MKPTIQGAEFRWDTGDSAGIRERGHLPVHGKNGVGYYWTVLRDRGSTGPVAGELEGKRMASGFIGNEVPRHGVAGSNPVPSA